MTGDQRFVFSARIIGSVRRDAPKLKTFMISVLWSDQTEVIIYRSFQDFREFHRQLKKRFPHMNPLRKDDRMIPKFRGKARRSSLQQKGSKKSVRRMRFLESYCKKLLMCEQTVTQSSQVTRFFTPKDHDLDPDFTKNSIMILLADNMSDESGGGGGGVASSISNPFVTHTCRCVGDYETKDLKNRPFKVAEDELLDVVMRNSDGWWLVENEEKRMAWFPATYLELWEPEDDDDDDSGFHQAGALYVAVRNYSTTNRDEVSVSIGSVVEVLRKSDNGWWLIRFNGNAGYIPSQYLQPYNNPRAGLHSLQRKLHSSTLNLATSRDLQASYPPSINEENSPQRDSAGPSGPKPSVPGRLHKSRSLDVLSESWSQTETAGDTSTSDDRRRSTSSTSNESSFSYSSSSSESPSQHHSDSHQPKVGDSLPSNPDLSPSNRRSSNTSTESSESAGSKSREKASVTPRVPPRPKTEEILTRCTTMTRKAALATKTQLQNQPEFVRSRV